MKQQLVNIVSSAVEHIQENSFSPNNCINCFNHKLKNMHNYKKMKNSEINIPKKLITVDLLQSIIIIHLGEKHGQN